MVEHVVHTLHERQGRPGFMENGGVLSAIRDAALEVERPIFFSLLIIISAYIPLFTLERVERKLFTPMAFTVCYALLGSMLLALTLIPVLATYLFRHGTKSWDNPILPWLARAMAKEVGCQDRDQRERKQHRSQKGVANCKGHRREKLPLDPLQREERDIGGDDDQ